MNKLIKSATESRHLLQDTLNVKLRYEEIIKAILENETKGNLRSAHEIITSTQASKKVQIDKHKPLASASTVSLVQMDENGNYKTNASNSPRPKRLLKPRSRNSVSTRSISPILNL